VSTPLGPSISGTLSTWVPTWMGNVPGLRNLYWFLWTIARLGDSLREIVWEGQLAAYPGIGTPDALPFIGASRGLVQGPLEPDALFAARCIDWLATNGQRGDPVQLVEQLQAYLVSQGSLGSGVFPVICFIDRAGNRTTIHANNSVSQDQVSWNWDENVGWTDDVGHKDVTVIDNWWSDGWLIIEDPYTHYTGFSDSNWLSAWNSGDETVDSLCPQEVVAGVQSIVDNWKGCHVYVRCIVWTSDPVAFHSTPGGNWGNWSVNSSGEQEASRIGTLSYWQPPKGG
jgi:hypothetical protein